MRSLWAFIRLSRPHFLLGGVLMFGLGAATAARLDVIGYIAGQLMITSGQVTAHYLNEFSDLEADRGVKRRTLFSGGSGVLVEGLLGPEVALGAAKVSTAVAMASAVVLARGSLPAALLGIAALGVSWSYSMPPIRLLGSGWGELVTSTVVAGIVPIIGVFAQGSSPTRLLWWTVVILIPIHGSMMLAFELPDLDTDLRAGKLVLAVRIGAVRARRLIGLLLVGSALVAGLAGLRGGVPEAALVWAGLGIVPALVMLAAMKAKRQLVLPGAAVATFVAVATGLLVGVT